MNDCLFCAIATKEIPSECVYEDDKVYAFKDINPEAPIHILIIPKQHIMSAMELDDENNYLVAHIFNVAKSIAKKLEIDKSGFRIINNCGEDGGQTIGHLHFHMLGGKKLLEKLGR